MTNLELHFRWREWPQVPWLAGRRLVPGGGDLECDVRADFAFDTFERKIPLGFQRPRWTLERAFKQDVGVLCGVPFAAW